MNRRIGDLQSPALPLGYGAVVGLFLRIPISACVGRAKISTFRNTLLPKLNPRIQFCKGIRRRKSVSSEATSSRNESRFRFVLEVAFSVKAAASERLGETLVHPSETVVSLGEEKHTRPAKFSALTENEAVRVYFDVERATRFELATSTLARWRSAK